MSRLLIKVDCPPHVIVKALKGSMWLPKEQPGSCILEIWRGGRQFSLSQRQPETGLYSMSNFLTKTRANRGFQRV